MIDLVICILCMLLTIQLVIITSCIPDYVEYKRRYKELSSLHYYVVFDQIWGFKDPLSPSTEINFSDVEFVYFMDWGSIKIGGNMYIFRFSTFINPITHYWYIKYLKYIEQEIIPKALPINQEI